MRTINIASSVCLIRSEIPVQKETSSPTIKRIPDDDVWNEIKNILPKEKPRNTKGHPAVPFRQVLDGVLFVLRTGYQWNMLPKEYGSGSIPVIDSSAMG